MAKALDDLSRGILPADASGGVDIVSGEDGYRRAVADGVVVHCFVDPRELRRLLTVMVAAELAGAMIQAQLSG